MKSNRAQFKPGDFSLGQAHEFLGAFGRQGGTPDLLQKGIEDQVLMERVVNYWQRSGYEATTNQRTAQEIMGSHYLGPKAVFEHFGLEYTAAQRIKLFKIPFSEDVLRKCKKTHILFAGYPLSILDIRKRVDKDLFYDQGDWYNSENFTNEKINLRWYLIRKDIISRSTSLTYEEQLHLLNENEEVPRAVEIVYMTILYYLVTDIRLFENVYACCRGIDSDSNRIKVGYFSRDGLVVNWWYKEGHDYIGLAPSKKL